MQDLTDTANYQLRQETNLPMSKTLQEIYKKAKKLAQTNGNILLLGETGTGKNFLASQLSLVHPMYKKNFVEVITTAIPPQLFESILFGYVKGAYTGALKDTLGKVHMADKGTLFLDEIAEIPIELQAKLLQFIEQKRFYRVGSTKLESVDLKIICATNKTLKELKNSQKFRQDLLYRFMSPIEIPALRSYSSEYITKLIKYIVQQYTPFYSKGTKVTVDKETLDILLSYPWPGNIRELKTVVKEMLTLSSPENVINNTHIPLHIGQYSTDSQDILESLNLSDRTDVPSMQQIKQAYAQKIYQMYNKNITHAANCLKIQRNTLKQMLKKNS